MLQSDTSEDASPEEELSPGFLGSRTSSDYVGQTPSPQWASSSSGACRKNIPLDWDATFDSQTVPLEGENARSKYGIANQNFQVRAFNTSSKSLHDELNEQLSLKSHSPEHSQGNSNQNENGRIQTCLTAVTEKTLPPGWERHEDANGSYYYWHIPSGTIQRREPTPVARLTENGNNDLARPLNTVWKSKSPLLFAFPRNTPSPLSSSSVHSSSSQQSSTRLQSKAGQQRHRTNSQSSAPASNKSQKRPGSGEPIKFTVVSLGWVHVPGEQLSRSELSSHVVEECIKELRKEATEEFGFDAAQLNGNGQRSRGRQLQLVLYDDCICVVDPDDDNRVLSHQPLYLIRVWGTTRTALQSSSNNDTENGSPVPTPLFPIPVTTEADRSLNETDYLEYFAFVARDRYSENYYKCFVYRCIDNAAAEVTHALNLKCESYLRQYYTASNASASPSNYADDSNKTLLPKSNTNGAADRPKSLLGSVRPSLSMQHFSSTATCDSSAKGLTDFLTPMQEPRKLINNTRYVGSMPVPNSTGIDETNNTINMLVEESKLTHGANEFAWPEVIVEVSPSMLAIRRVDNNDADEYYDDDGYATAAIQSPSTFTGGNDLDADSTVIECRIRYLSFLGISRDDPHFCGFVIMTPDDAFVCHVVYGEHVGNITHLCKTVEAACTLRYQKFLDAHTTTTPTGNNSTNGKSNERTNTACGTQAPTSTANLGAKIRGLFSTSWTSLMSPSTSSAPVGALHES